LMRRYSQRTQLVTLSDINVTPLLDLAFVLLIIFAITAPLLEQSIEIRLPEGGAAGPSRPNVRDVVTAEVSPSGDYYLQGRKLTGLPELEQRLVEAHRANPNLIVRIRADATSMYRYPVAIMDACRRHGITRFDLATEVDR
jgi:biopolymer transport protein ExbD